MPTAWCFGPEDAAFAASLHDRLPERVFDAHAHIYARPAGLTGGVVGSGPARVGISEWREHVGKQVGVERLQGALFIAFPDAGDGGARNQNAFLLSELDRTPGSHGSILVWPDMPEKELDELLSRPDVAGIKPYHVFSSLSETFEAPIDDYCPEWIWKQADAHGAIITLHMVRAMALSDAGNLATLTRLCEKYANARIVLAHAGRGFHAPHTVEAVRSIRHLGNIWFDTSAICEPEALLAILDEFGPTRLLWGSDFPVSEQRGKCVTVGDAFAWINPDRVDSHATAPACRTYPVGLEALSALLRAAAGLGLNSVDMEDIFCRNAERLLKICNDVYLDVQSLYREGKKRMPGGTQLLSKRPEMFAPEQWPAYFTEARGCEVMDTDGKRYYDLSYNGIGSCCLGFRDPDVTRAVCRRVRLGAMSTLNPPEELSLADRLCELHPWADCARFARTGGEIAAVAIRIARATTGRDKVAVCGYHGWHDWYLAANLAEGDALAGHLLEGLDPAGVPRSLSGSTVTFGMDDLVAFEATINEHGDDLACVIMEPCRHHEPSPGFLEAIRETCSARGILLIFDEITVGFRLIVGGAHLLLGVEPDMAIFAKALGNGHPIATVLGRREAMEGAHRSFISSTYWTESVGPAAALAVLDKMGQVDLPAVLATVGKKIRSIWGRQSEAAGLSVLIEGGFDCMPRFQFAYPSPDVVKTLFTQEMLKLGFLAGPAVYPTLAHTDDILGRYEAAVGTVFQTLAEAIDTDTVSDRLAGPIAHKGFTRLVD